MRAGATPVLADIDPVTFNLSPAAVSAVLDGPRGANVSAILPVHLYGQISVGLFRVSEEGANWPSSRTRRRPGAQNGMA